MDMMAIRRRVLMASRERKSKNLIPPFDYPNAWGNGYIQGSGNIAASNNYRYLINPIEILSDTDYTLSASNGAWMGIIYYNSNMQKVDFKEAATNSVTLKSPSDAVYARVYLQITLQDYMFEQGSSRSDYEPY